MNCLGKEAHFTQFLNNRNYYFILIAYSSNIVELSKKCRRNINICSSSSHLFISYCQFQYYYTTSKKISFEFRMRCRYNFRKRLFMWCWYKRWSIFWIKTYDYSMVVLYPKIVNTRTRNYHKIAETIVRLSILFFLLFPSTGAIFHVS